MNITAICSAWRGIASPLPLKACQRLHVREMLRAARHEATIRNAPGVRELVNGKWIIPAPTYFQHNARQQRA